MIPVILCGGSGTRLWPLSRDRFPKQFINLVGDNSLLQETVTRCSGIKEISDPILVCNEEHRFLVGEQLREMGCDSFTVLLEPASKNTAPAIAFAANYILKSEDAILLVLPSDHFFSDIKQFVKSVEEAINYSRDGSIVTLGVLPASPETGYGYILKGEQIDRRVYSVEKFIEKPDEHAAAEYFVSGEYFWNSGIFVFKASSYVDELKRNRPDIFEGVEASMVDLRRDHDFLRVDREIYSKLIGESIDYAIMESTEKAVVVSLESDWSDMGSWKALYEFAEKDDENNTVWGDVFLRDVKNSLVRAEGRMVAAFGLEGFAVVETSDAVMISPLSYAQNIKSAADELKILDREETERHQKVFRPWGYYENLEVGKLYKVKRISVKPNESLSLQLHHHRSEHWVVVRGVATVTLEQKVFLLQENQSCFIPANSKHRLQNLSQDTLEIIEVQTGVVLEEDDIVRFEDEYGR
ncbi:MAG: mannose-1-phosphate guanylyltransferase/mannose-6-phosphate isomerase [Gammaproteobacteria bacterium]|nr:mannose-1-phosphate guanylyltransferase/mannose-6-phosphate isomerase [Gammaproteobacteria bacterium]